MFYQSALGVSSGQGSLEEDGRITINTKSSYACYAGRKRSIDYSHDGQFVDQRVTLAGEFRRGSTLRTVDLALRGLRGLTGRREM